MLGLYCARQGRSTAATSLLPVCRLSVGPWLALATSNALEHGYDHESARAEPRYHLDRRDQLFNSAGWLCASLGIKEPSAVVA